MKTALPKRVFNSPLIEFANFEDGSHINLIRLIKPYANGISYAVYVNNPNCSNGLFKTYDKAKEKFEAMVKKIREGAALRNKDITHHFIN